MSFDPISYIEALKSRRLSNLIIDTDKDWGGRLIKNLGEPVDPNDAARKIYVDVATTGLGINYYLLDEADSEVTAYKKLSITPPELSEAYVEVTQNSSGDYEIASWIADGITLKLGVYTLHFQAEKISGNIDVRLFFRLYERDTGGNETLIAESYLSDLITERRNVVIGLILAHDYEMAEGSRLVLKVFARYLSGGSPTTVRIYYQGAVRSRLAIPIAKEILDTLYAQRLHASQHSKGGEDELSLDASQIVSGVLSVDRIPDLPRSKITDFFNSPFWDSIPDKPFETLGSEFTVSDGVLEIAGIDASKITSGRLSLSRLPTSSYANRFLVVRTANSDPVWDVLTADDIPNLDASKITSGVFDVARIPDLSRSKITDFFDSPFWDNIPDKPSYFPSKASLFTVDADIIPDSDNTRSLGSESVKWATVHSTTYYAYGRVKVTYGAPYLLLNNVNTGDVQSHIRFSFADTEYFRIYCQEDVNILGVWAFMENGASSSRSMLVIDANSNEARFRTTIRPLVDNTFDLGTSSMRWANIHGVNFYASGKIVLDNDKYLEWKNSTGTEQIVMWLGRDDSLRVRTVDGKSIILGVNRKNDIIVDNQGIANSTNTIYPSNPLVFLANYWDGSQGVDRAFSIQHVMIDTTPKSELVFKLADREIIKIGDDGIKIRYGAKWEQLIFDNESTDTIIEKRKVAGKNNWLWLNAYADSGYSATIGLFRYAVDGDAFFRICKADGTADATFQINAKTGQVIARNIVPQADNAYSLGSESAKWKDLFLRGTLTGNIYTTLDNSGRSTKFLSKAGSAPHTDFHFFADYVRPDTSANVRIMFGYNSEITRFHVHSKISGTNLELVRIEGDGSGMLTRSVKPLSDNTYDLGDLSLKWSKGYFAGVFIGTAEVGDAAANMIDLGVGDSEREQNAGKIAYGRWDTNCLCIVGKGTSAGSRLIRFYDKVGIGTTPSEQLDVNGNAKLGAVYPRADNSYDFGTSSNRWRKAYLGSFQANGADCYIDAYGLVIGNTSGRASGERLELYGGTSSMILSVQDGNGRIQMKWNATRGTGEKFLVGGENAGMWEFDPSAASTDLFRIKFADGSSASAGDSISWQDILQVGTSGMKLFKSGFYPGSDNTLNIGSSSLRWKAIYVVDVYTGDINLDNGWKITELPNGVIIKNEKGEEVFRITEEGVWFKGKKIAG